MNVLEASGHQTAHTHSNSFILGVLCLTRSHPFARRL